jgi:hypothetical protein
MEPQLPTLPAERVPRKVPAKRHAEWMQKVTERAATFTPSSLRPIPLSEVAAHSAPTDAWTAIRGVVYDVTEYLDYHPGGRAQLLRTVGQDGTELFDLFHRYVNIDVMLRPWAIGLVTPEPRATAAPGSATGTAADGGVSSSAAAKPLLRQVRWSCLPVKSVTQTQDPALLHVRFELPAETVAGGGVLGFPIQQAAGLAISMRIPGDNGWFADATSGMTPPLYPSRAPPGDTVVVQPVILSASEFEVTLPFPSHAAADASAATSSDMSDVAGPADTTTAVTGLDDDDDEGEDSKTVIARLAERVAARALKAGDFCFFRGPSSHQELNIENVDSEIVASVLSSARLPPNVRETLAGGGISLTQAPPGPVAAWVAPVFRAGERRDADSVVSLNLRGIPLASVVLLCDATASPCGGVALVQSLWSALSGLRRKGVNASSSASASSGAAATAASAASDNSAPVWLHVLICTNSASSAAWLAGAVTAALAAMGAADAPPPVRVSVVAAIEGSATAPAPTWNTVSAVARTMIIPSLQHATLLQSLMREKGDADGRWWPAAPESGTLALMCGGRDFCEQADDALRQSYFLADNFVRLRALPYLVV